MKGQLIAAKFYTKKKINFDDTTYFYSLPYVQQECIRKTENYDEKEKCLELDPNTPISFDGPDEPMPDFGNFNPEEFGFDLSDLGGDSNDDKDYMFNLDFTQMTEEQQNCYFNINSTLDIIDQNKEAKNV